MFLRQKELESQKEMTKYKYDALVLEAMTSSEIGGGFKSMMAIKNHEEIERLQKTLKLDLSFENV
jgi:hypothetical protein